MALASDHLPSQPTQDLLGCGLRDLLLLLLARHHICHTSSGPQTHSVVAFRAG